MDCAALHAPYCSGSGLGAQEGEILHIMIGVSWDVELDPDKAVHIMHITVGTSTVHLVGKKSAMEFDMFTMSLYEEDMGLLNQAGYIHILKDKGDVQYVHNWESL